MDTTVVAVTIAVVAAIASIVSALVSMLGLRRKAREDALRTIEVQDWANNVTCELVAIRLISGPRGSLWNAVDAQGKLRDAILATSILVEKGRFFFKNEVVDTYGAANHDAYRGYRPRILDPIVTAHQIACKLGDAEGDRRLRMHALADDCLRTFVSLAQKEVGRARVKSDHAGAGGAGSHLESLLASITTKRLVAVRHANDI